MNLCGSHVLLNKLNVNRLSLITFRLSFPVNTYAKKDTGSVSMLGGVLKKKKIGKIGPVTEKKILPVETDPDKLVNYVCGSNIYKTGEDVKLLPDEEYPDWLWKIRTGKPIPFDQLDPNSKEYWKRVRKMGMRQNNILAQIRRF